MYVDVGAISSALWTMYSVILHARVLLACGAL